MRIGARFGMLAMAGLTMGAFGCGTGGTPAASDTGAVEATPDRPETMDSGPAPVETEPPVVEPALLPADTDGGPRVESDEELAEIPSMPISQLLGKTRAHIETLFYPAREGHVARWVRYNEHLEVRYEKGRCVELIQHVRSGLTCRDAARWIGFGEAMAPIYRAKSCVWPPNSIKHSLGKGFSGELILEGGVFRARLDW